jgi:hypothetical protein
MHWTKMHDFHLKIADEQRREGVRVIVPPHALGFLDPSLPEKSRPLAGQGSPLPTNATPAQG